MKTLKYILISILFGVSIKAAAQTPENLVLWDFRSADGAESTYDYATSPVLPDESNENNTGATFFTEGRKITGHGNGYVFSTGWEYIESTPRYWIIKDVNTAGYYSLSFVFDMGGSSGNAPRDFEVEYNIAETVDWVSLGSLMSPQSLTEKIFPLPRDCENKTISLRIRLTSNYKINGANEAQTNTQNRLDNVKVIGYAEPTEPSIVTSLSTYSVCDAEKNVPASFNVDITGKKLTGALTLTVQPPFTVDKPTIEPENGSIAETVTVHFTPAEAAEYNGRLIISGGGADEKIITLRVLAQGYELPALPNPTLSGIKPAKDDLYNVKIVEGGISVANTENLSITVYDAAGIKIKSTQGKPGYLLIPIEMSGIYLVKIGDVVKKVSINK